MVDLLFPLLTEIPTLEQLVLKSSAPYESFIKQYTDVSEMVLLIVCSLPAQLQLKRLILPYDWHMSAHALTELLTALRSVLMSVHIATSFIQYLSHSTNTVVGLILKIEVNKDMQVERYSYTRPKPTINSLETAYAELIKLFNIRSVVLY